MIEQGYEFTLTGLSPLLLHWDNYQWADAMKEERDKIKTNDKKNFSAGDDRCPPFTWKGCVYNDGTDVALPNDNLRSCLMKAGARVILSKQKSYKELTQSAILFDDMYLKLLVGGKPVSWTAIDAIKGTFAEQCEAVKPMGFSLFVKRATVGQSKHIRVRPKFDEWSVKGRLTILDEQLADVLAEIWRIAGLQIGCCDWRSGSPRSPGPYGRFNAVVKKV